MYSLKYKVTTSTWTMPARHPEGWRLQGKNYVRMAMELLPENFVVNGLRVEYRVAAKLGDCLIPTIYKIADGIIVSLSIESEVSAIIEFT